MAEGRIREHIVVHPKMDRRQMKKRINSLLFLVTLSVSAPAAAQDVFGSAVAVHGESIWVLKPNAGIGYAGLYQFEREAGGEWNNSLKLRPTGDGNSGEGFSPSMAVSGDLLLVGSGDPEVNYGAHVFVRDGVWEGQPRIPLVSDFGGVEQTAFDLAALQRIMSPQQRSVTVDGNRAAMVAVGATGDPASLRILARTDAAGWAEESRIEAPDTAATRFGWSLKFRENILFVGAPAFGRAGAVFVYSESGDGWEGEAVIEPAGLSADAGFGSSISVGATSLFVGAPGSNTTGGTVLEYSNVSGAWTEIQTIAPTESSAADRFGTAIALERNELWIGSPGADSRSGRVRRFIESSDGRWRETNSILPTAVEPGFRFGEAIALSANTAVVGAPGADGNTGWAAAFSRTGADEWSSGEWLKISESLETIATGEEVRCLGGGASQFSCRGVDLLSFLSIPSIGGDVTEGLSDLWGWTDPATGNEYALVGRTNGTAFVDITNPSDPRYLGVMPANASGTRDIKVYDDHVFVTGGNAGDHGMLIMDLTRLRNPGLDPVVFEPDAVYRGISSAHNLIINTTSGFAFAVGSTGGGQTCGGGLHMIDIREPLNPTFAGCYTDTEGLIWQGRTHDAQCVVYEGPDENFQDRQICIASNETAIRIVDVTDKENPMPISASTYPGMSYVHQGWLTEDQRYFFLNDELDELVGQADFTRTLIWDVAELDDPILVGEYFGPNSATDHNLYIKGDKMYQANYQAGLRVIDISDPENPAEVGFFDTTPYDGDPTGFNGGAWTAFPFFESGTVIVSSSGEGLFVVRPSGQELVP